MKRAFKKTLILTGGSGLLGSYFKKKFKKKYRIINYPHRIENISKFKSNDEYIKSLKIKLDIKLNSKKNLKRLAQMTQKTNQFNSTTIRLNEKKASPNFDWP